MAGGGGVNFDSYLQQKYDIERQKAGSEANLQNAQAAGITGALGSENALRTAQANETNQRAGTVNPLAQAQIGLSGAQATGILGSLGSENALRGAQTYETQQRGATLQPLANSSIASNAANINEANARSNLLNTQSSVAGQQTQPYDPFHLRVFYNVLQGKNNGNILDYTPGDDEQQVQGHAKGTAMVKPSKPMKGGKGGMPQPAGLMGALPSLMGMSGGSMTPNPQGAPAAMGAFKTGVSKVPGHGSGHVDTVPAMLAPGEAVLNKGAAEHMGRGAIETLNAIGLHKMGMAPGAPQPAQQAAPPMASKGPAKPPGRGMKKPPGFATGTSNVEDWKRTDRMPTPPSAPTSGSADSYDRAGSAWGNRADLTTQSPVHYPSPAELDRNVPQRYAEGTANVGATGVTTYGSIPPAVPGGGKRMPGKGMLPPKKVAARAGMK